MLRSSTSPSISRECPRTTETTPPGAARIAIPQPYRLRRGSVFPMTVGRSGGSGSEKPARSMSSVRPR